MNVLFAPDWTAGVPYQRLLAEALVAEGVDVELLRHYRRLLPLSRLVRHQAQKKPVDALHLHWPEAYYPPRRDGLDLLRRARYPLDLALARRGRALVLTAHNLHAHNRQHEPLAHWDTRTSLTQANHIIAHSAACKMEIQELFSIPDEKIHVIPHGDLAISLGPPLDRADARRALGISDEPVVLMFGTVEPYKGFEEILDCWRDSQPSADLAIIGRASSETYGAEIAARAAGVPRVRFHQGWLTDENLRQWLSAVDAVLVNYRTIFTSGAACLARSYGVPVLLPTRLTTVDLAEPSPYVRRFADPREDLPRQLTSLLSETTPSFVAAAPWRTATSWSLVAKATARVYRAALGR